MPPPNHETDPGQPLDRRADDQEWSDRCSYLFQEMRRPARAMIARAYGRALREEEVEDIYSSAWAAMLSALRTRGRDMAESELRAYILTAVASHASKEMRRRHRKPTGSIEPAAEQVLADGHQPLPDEIAIGSEERSMARDVLSSLPQRRRAVMFLRFGWGLSPNEVCALIPGLSPRAYRKEVTKGTEQLLDSLRRVDSGEWCLERELLVRDLVAGTADEDSKRQAEEHLSHCAGCSDLAARLRGQLHDIGSSIALGSVIGAVGVGKLGLIERIVSLGSTGSSSSMAGAGVAAKIAGVGGAGKAVMACVGAGAAATACVAAGVIPGVSLDGGDRSAPSGGAVERVAVPEREAFDPRPAVSSVTEISHAVSEVEGPVEEEQEAPTSSGPSDDPPQAPSAPSVDPEVQEFDPIVQSAPTPTPAPSPAPPSTEGPSGSSAAQEEFGP